MLLTCLSDLWLVRLEPSNSGNYVVLSKVYAEVDKYTDQVPMPDNFEISPWLCIREELIIWM